MDMVKLRLLCDQLHDIHLRLELEGSLESVSVLMLEGDFRSHLPGERSLPETVIHW